MKYIIFASAEGPRLALFAAPTTHTAEAAAHPLWNPKSAGYVEFLGAGKVRCFSYSDSLNLRPGLQDESLIQIMMSATLRIAPPADHFSP